ncbi:ZIP family metal transporter [Candidatus Halobonum tyrrellensis]|uniref:Zinc/iron permease n=1 Tax=Candidatus Halobonum tyrrellensis G22 TaxID=1324957 RepID=V4GP81_9EURY|nr:ZIP family metal transporter [Candidatus Halobonum tyrrellensis]ESP87206.1 zinc/iron permease [Candidatus Halobonum tyrrellensis G22]
MFEDAFVSLVGTNPILQALVGGFVIAGMNMVGALLVLVYRDPSERALDAALGFAAGVMLAASFTSLIVPGIDATEVLVPGVPATGLLRPIPVIAGLLLGAALLDQADHWVPHVHVLITGRSRADQTVSDAGPGVAAVLLFIVAITIHNMPEGLAVGVGFGSGDIENAVGLMLAIGIQNVPEGLAVSVAAVNAGFDRTSYAVLTGVRSGLVEIPLTVLGAYAVGLATPILPYAMGFAAGGMLFVISDEIVPETHARGNERLATLGTMFGAAVMLYLDVALAA